MHSRQLQVEYTSIETVSPDPANPRLHKPKQLKQLVESIRRFGFTNPILVDDAGHVIAGHGRLEAAKLAGLSSVPVIRIGDLSLPERRALMVADNRLAETSCWDPARLQEVMQNLIALDVVVDDLGFDPGELDKILGHVDTASIVDEADTVELPATAAPTIARVGDVFALGDHVLACMDARDPGAFETVLGGAKAQLVFTDPPYNLKAGHISGLGKTKHGEFQMASGEMSAEAFTDFLRTALACLATASADGAILYVCMDWRHIQELLDASKGMFALKNLCVWAKDNGGMGSLYRSQHELVFVFKHGSGAHINNVNLGRLGRNRTNLWSYPGANTLRKGRLADLRDHPTVKPVAMVADAILDCSRPGDLVLDPFAGSGTILLAAQRTGRRACAIEIDPGYVDTAIRRFQVRTGISARHAGTGLEHAELGRVRSTGAVSP